MGGCPEADMSFWVGVLVGAGVVTAIVVVLGIIALVHLWNCL